MHTINDLKKQISVSLDNDAASAAHLFFKYSIENYYFYEDAKGRVSIFTLLGNYIIKMAIFDDFYYWNAILNEYVCFGKNNRTDRVPHVNMS